MNFPSWVLNRYLQDLFKSTFELDDKGILYRNNLCLIILSHTSMVMSMNEYISYGLNRSVFDKELEDEYKASIKLVDSSLDALLIQHKMCSYKLDVIAWKKGQAPFQNFEILNSIRNEFVHYEGKWLPDGAGPNKRITHLMNQLKVEKNAGWVQDLLNNINFTKWLSQT